MVSNIADTNIVLRYLLNDDPVLSPKAKDLFAKAADHKISIYLDELALAEIIWVLIKHYKQPKDLVVANLQKLISQDWIVNPRKSLLEKSFFDFTRFNISFIDSWLFNLGRETGHRLETFDKKLKNLK